MAIDLEDKTSNGNDLTNSGADEETSDLPAGLSGATNAVDFVAANSDLLSRASADLTGFGFSTTFTIECWAKFSDINAHQTIASRWTTNNNWLFYYRNVTDKLRMDMFDTDGSTRDIIEWDVSAYLGSWYHYAVTIDVGNASATTCELFVDGSSEGNGSVAIGGNVGTLRNDTSPLEIGGVVGYYDGFLKDLRFWNDVRTSTEISDNYGSFLTGSEAGLVAYYPFEALPAAASTPTGVLTPSSKFWGS